MSQTSSLPGGDSLPELPGDSLSGPNARPKDRTKSTATRRRDDVPEEKAPNIFQPIVLFVQETIAEMKKVTYPSKEELWTYFLVVLLFVAAMMTFTGLVDFGFGELSTLVFG